MRTRYSLMMLLAGLGVLSCPPTFGQKAVVTVNKGLVRAETTGGTVLIAAGQKTVLAAGQTLASTAGEPMVDELIRLSGWIDAERQANRIPIDTATIQIARIESEKLVKLAYLCEMLNADDKPGTTCRVGLTSILNNPQYYDMQGRLLAYDLEKKTDDKGYYHVHFADPVAAGANFRFVCVTQTTPPKECVWQEGKVWHVWLANDTPSCLNYFRLILPPSAILIDVSTRPLMVDQQDGRVSVTIRNYTGKSADGQVQVAFLWPDKDGTSLDDLPAQYRGLRDVRDSQLTEVYREQMTRIEAGGDYNDQGTPFAALLTRNAAIVRQDKARLIDVVWMPGDDNRAKIREALNSADNAWDVLTHKFVDSFEFLGTPAWPEKPEEGCLHPVYLCRKGSLLRDCTFVAVYHAGKWYMSGQLGPRQADPNAPAK